jgi:hypothetical protein
MAKITRLSKHLQEKAERNGVALSLIWEIVNNPGLTYDSFATEKVGDKKVKVRRNCRCGTQQQKWTGVASNGQAFCVAVNACCGIATTYWDDQVETPLRPDQIEKGITGYNGKDGKWREGGRG